jgi:aspartyl-tRNA(Asn)/glutamyl-tRNA(Gln) amidotransferase subunit A
MRRVGAVLPPFAGIPISLKDLFDIAGETTTAGSVVLADRPPAERDAPAVARVRAAGFIPIGRTNMTEFAFSAIGINPHHGTPANAFDRGSRRIPGGSSSGAAIAITDSMALASVGTDTGGSCRIPAALNGIVGFKPTARRVPLEGAVPLSASLDSIGPLVASVDDAVIVDAVLAGENVPPAASRDLRGLRLGVPQTLVLDSLEPAVAAAFEAALGRLSAAGAQIVDVEMRLLSELAHVNAKGGFPAAEAYAWHRALIEARGAGYDPRVLRRILRGREAEAADYVDLVAARRDLIARMEAMARTFDALVMPTVPIVAPTIASLAEDDEFTRVNLLLLRNPTIANFFDGCAVTVPCNRPVEAPVGLMLQGIHGADRDLLSLAASVEATMSRY